MNERELTILIVDDHKMLLEGIRGFVVSQFPNATVLLASSHKEIVSVLNKRAVDILLLDLLLGEEDSRTFLLQLQQFQEDMKIVVVSSLEEEIVVNALLQNGVNGFVGKSSSTMYIAEAMNAVLDGGIYIDPVLSEHIKEKDKHLKSTMITLTPREKEVLNETLKEKKIKEIAEALFISTKTVENHRSNLFAKFDVSNVAGLVKKALLLGYIPDNIK